MLTLNALRRYLTLTLALALTLTPTATLTLTVALTLTLDRDGARVCVRVPPYLNKILGVVPWLTVAEY